MAYTKQNFTNGQVLTAAQMNKIDDSLYALSNKQRRLRHIEFKIAERTDTTLLSWVYYYDDGTNEELTDTSLSSNLETLSERVLSVIQTGGTFCLSIHDDEGLTLIGTASYSYGFQLFNRTYIESSNGKYYTDYYITQEESTSEIVVSMYTNIPN